MTKRADEIKARLTADTPRVPPIPPEDFVSLGLTVLNLAVSGHPDRGVAKGQYLLLVGESGAAKTWTCMNLFAEAAKNPAFAKHRFVFDNAENGALMDVERYFGRAAAERIEPPAGDRDEPRHSSTVEQFYYHIDDAMDAGPVIYVLDSMDALVAEDDEDKFEGDKKAFKEGRGASGSYGMAKAKENSRSMGRVVKRLRETGSILGMISQTREKIGGPFPGMKTRSGGKALRFGAHVEVWTSVKGPIKVSKLGKDREVGATIVLDVQKNRVSGWEGKVTARFLRQEGWDELGTNLEYLVEEGHWKKAEKGGAIDATEYKYKGRAEDLLGKLQDLGREAELARIVARVWAKIEAACKLNRKPRYT